jgi:predicted N-formylglutamate amidohydrolase
MAELDDGRVTPKSAGFGALLRETMARPVCPPQERAALLATEGSLRQLRLMASFAPFERIEGPPESGVLIICDHASNALPPEYGSLGLGAEAFGRHIAYDIGAAGVTRGLARRLNAPAVLSTFSRLLIDPNRGADDPTLVMRLSDGALIPGNARIDQAEIDRRRERYWRPYRDAAAAEIDAMLAAGVTPAILSIHSFTPVWKGAPRPWHVALLWDLDARLARPLFDALGAERDLVVGDNEPYDGALEGDTMFDLGTARGLPHVLIEIRQDLIADEKGQAEWAGRLAGLLAPILGEPDLHRIELHDTRTKGAKRGAP